MAGRQLVVMVAEQTVAVLEEVPDDKDVEPEHDQNGHRKVIHQPVNFDGDEEGRFTNCQLSGPTDAKHQTNPLNE